MKDFLAILACVVMTFCLLSACTTDPDGYKEKIYYELEGQYTFFYNDESGVITFNNEGNFTMKSPRGNIACGDYTNTLNESEIIITWAEDEAGEPMLTEEEMENGIIVKIEVLDKNDAYFYNFPLYRNCKLLASKITN